MNRVLVVGDLHCHFDVLDKVKALIPKYDKVIFLGDYVDDWNAIPESSYNMLTEVINLKLDNPDKIICLCGNHSTSEWFGERFRCSGYNEFTHNLVKPLFDKYEHLFDIAYAPDKHTIYSHAGFTRYWVKQTFNKNFRSATELARAINKAFHNRNNPESTHQKEYEETFYHLTDVGHVRGGWTEPSPLWADADELVIDRLNGITQIVGHTPVRTVQHFTTSDTDLYFCDTFSTYPDSRNIGDCSLLTFEDNSPVKISLDGKQIAW